MESTKIQIPICDLDEIKTNLNPIFETMKAPRPRKDGGYASLRKHGFMIHPIEGKTITDIKLDDVCTDFVCKMDSDRGYVIKFKIINQNILICEFEKATRCKFNEFTGLHYVAKRFKYSQLYDTILPYDLIADLKGEEDPAQQKEGYCDETIESFLRKKRHIE